MSNKRKNTAVILAIAVAIIALLFWWRLRETSQVASTPAAPVARGGPPDKLSGDQPPATRKASPELRKTFEALNHNPVEFYGRAIDQSGAPVADAEVRGTLLINTGTSGGEKRVNTTTDAQGYFQFTDLKGQDLGIFIAKEGYEYSRKVSSFSYSYFEADHKRHVPDSKNPVIFVLWKKQGAERLIHYDKVWRFPVNTGPMRIDLLSGKLANQDADLIVTVSRDPLRMPPGTRGFAWQARVDVEGGGLLLAAARDYYNMAPEASYSPTFEHKETPQNPTDYSTKWTWKEETSGIFFISSRNGKNFARVNLRIKPDVDHKEGENEAMVAAEVWLNPNGSRNLEFDPAKAITPP